MTENTIDEKQIKASFERALSSPRLSGEYVRHWMNTIRFDGISEENELIFSVPSLFHRDFIRDHYMDDLLVLMGDALPGHVEIVWRVDESIWNSQSPAGMAEKPMHLPPPNNAKPVPFSDIYNKLDSRFRFESFVSAPSNQLAFAGAQAIAETPNSAYNPLFIYGGSGLGKTHLLNAIGHRFLERHPDARVIYMSSEELTNDYIESLHSQRMSDFRKRMREDCDCLLIDDIQFLGNKERTQDEFFNIFNALHSVGKPVAMTSDRIPAEIEGIVDRLRTRFASGLLVDIQEPDFETRVAILKKKAEIFHIQLPDDVAWYIAKVVQSNVRELQMALNRVYAYHSLTRLPMTEEMAAETLKNVLPESKTLGIEDIQKEISKYYNVTVESLMSPRRQKNIVMARQMAMYIARKLTGVSYPEIGEHFHRDHSTVMSSCGKIEKELEVNEKLKRDLDELMTRLSNKGN